MCQHVVTSTFIGVSQNGDPALTHEHALLTELSQLEQTETFKYVRKKDGWKSMKGSTLTSRLWDHAGGALGQEH